MSNPVENIKTEGRQTGGLFKSFVYHWFSLLVVLYGAAGFLFYAFILLTPHDGAVVELPFRVLSGKTLELWLLFFFILHLAIFTGGIFLLYINKVIGFALFFAGMASVLLANAVINHQNNYFSWVIFLFLGLFLWRWRRKPGLQAREN